ncbi:hypothetical protein HMPREF9123_1574 [Neisseria bacilliformis ATCC BAA-1200]|uniref:Uncharacterized protein n=1 Tax=Neisseria bacilliformis ATCC BAA-1200 TaxID=888742 RepID=F2BCU4_9NEIS|nr:hypothetical protein HMPREF9123_1574 [Neisseria bacilliformis ATCC BAA-1200]
MRPNRLPRHRHRLKTATEKQTGRLKNVFQTAFLPNLPPQTKFATNPVNYCKQFIALF